MNPLLVLLLAFQPIFSRVTASAIRADHTRSDLNEARNSPSTETHNIARRLITTDTDWCNYKFAGASRDLWKPVAVLCNPQSMRQFVAACKNQEDEDAELQMVLWDCEVHLQCIQLENIVMWNGDRGTDIDCVRNEEATKWFIEAGKVPPPDDRKLCSPSLKRSATSRKLGGFEVNFRDNTGKRQKFVSAWVEINDLVYGTMQNADQFKFEMSYSEDITVRFCEQGGFDIDVEGYGTIV